ncbi:MAG: hypothetical protein NZL91_03675 [Thermoflexales bacterium]|nr:hypothetical protein [Thermoflexales bacterium]MCS7324787.1 hypothetical protein [Thermoflexales bacterium]MCX7938545.1 hypothetical protein [Thermoflexales bacterium]MDW8053111.1 hypothetical protein [Anaerolineae bacterium]MDW8291764.1 hypothetical protein [Anaerolineae bacterium]
MDPNRLLEDERISEYVDGQMSDEERTAFESRMSQDAALRRKVAITRLLVQEARALEALAVPRNFILPRDAAKQQQANASSPSEEEQPVPRENALRVLVRLGAALIVFAVVFVGALNLLPPLLVPRSPAPVIVQPTPIVPQAADDAAQRMMPMVAAPQSLSQQSAAAGEAAEAPPTTPPALAPAGAPSEAMPSRSPRPTTMVLLALVLILGLLAFWVIRARRR